MDTQPLDFISQSHKFQDDDEIRRMKLNSMKKREELKLKAAHE